MLPFDFTPGTAPILISIPHAGTGLPSGLAERLTPEATGLPDTDWFVDQLYDFAADLGISVLKAQYSRYVIDLNRPVDGSLLYPGRTETGLVATTTFDGAPLYKPGKEPDTDEIQDRIARYWQPYHQKLAERLNHLHQQHGQVLLWDAHSIKRQVPRLFEGPLPDLNFGSADGRSCAPEITSGFLELAKQTRHFSYVLNQRFKGGYITRHYGRPETGIHAIQLEMAQEIYMQESPPEFRPDRARVVQDYLKGLFSSHRNFFSPAD